MTPGMITKKGLNEMARPISKGLSYFAFDTDFFSDRKIKLIKSEFGIKGIMVLVYVLTQIYGDEGYYMRYDDDAAYLISDELGCGIDCKCVDEIIHGCARRSIFDDRVLSVFGVLTSKSIQRRFINAACSRDKVRIIGDYFLLEEEDIEKFSPKNLSKIFVDGVSLDKTKVSFKETEVSSESIPQSKEKKSKVNSNIEDEDFDTRNLETVEQYAINNLRYFGPAAMQEMSSFKEDMPEELIRYAIDEACSHCVRTWAYVRSILNTLLDNDCKTVDDAKALQPKKKDKGSESAPKKEVIWRV